VSLLSIFTKKSPNIGGLEFDAVLEGITSKSITLTEYPVEFGANVNDHRIINPDRYLMTGAISNTPLGFGLNDIGMIGVGAAATAIGGVAGGLVGSVAAYLLAGDDSTRSATAWEALSDLLYTAERFEIDTGLEVLSDMVLIRLDTRRDPETEDGVIFQAEIRKLNTVYTRLIKTGIKSKDQLPENDSATNQAAPSAQRGNVNTEIAQ
jgi:hypothetical protein